MVTYEEFKKALETVRLYKKQIESHYSEVENEMDNISKFYMVTPETEIRDTDLSVRTLNSLFGSLEYLGIKSIFTTKVSALEGISIKTLRKCRGIGKKSLDEIKELCHYAGVKLSK